MRAVRAWLARTAGLVGGARADREFEAELESHLQLHVDDNIRAGMTPQEARRRAVMALGGIDRTKDEYRDRRGIPALESLGRDLRHGARALAKSPGFTVAAIVILGLGIGVNTAIFTVVNAVVLRPLPFADADRIMRLWHTPPPTLFAGQPFFALSPANFIDWEAQTKTLERMAIYRPERKTLTGQGEPDAVRTIRASADFLPILGLSPTLGRGFTRDDDRAGGPPAALLDEGFFQSRFGGDRSIIGKTIVLNRVPHTVIGVVPGAPAFIDRVQAWVPLAWTPENRAVRNNHTYAGIAKLKPGVEVASAQADLTAISERLALQYPDDNKDWGALVRPLQDDMIGDARDSLLVLLGAVANVLTATVDIPEAKYETPEQRIQFFDRTLQSIRALPGVASAAWVDTLPLQGGSTQYVMVAGAPAMKESEMPVVAVRLPSPGYFQTAGIRFVAGRDFTNADGFGKPRVVIVSELTARRFWPGQDPIGKRITLTMMTKEAAEVVGVVREVKTEALDAGESDSQTAIYAPAAQFAFGGSTLAVRTTVAPQRLTRAVVAAVREIDPEQPVLDIATMADVVEESLGQRPFAMLLLTGFATLALILASVGIYSVLAYTVRQRVREIGIRLALGAPTQGLLRTIVIEGLKPTLVGVAVGLVLAAALGGVLSTLLYGVGAHDPGTYARVGGLVVVVGIVATLLPAYRATRVDPIVTLRAE